MQTATLPGAMLFSRILNLTLNLTGRMGKDQSDFLQLSLFKG
jgi:hypothetical protein